MLPATSVHGLAFRASDVDNRNGITYSPAVFRALKKGSVGLLMSIEVDVRAVLRLQHPRWLGAF
jgi:hypothetical protein